MKKTTGILLSIAVLAMLIGGSGAVYFYKQAEKSVTPLKESYTLKNKQAGEELHLSLKGKGPYTIYKTDSNNMGLRSPNNAFYSKAEGTLDVKEEKNKITATINTTRTQNQPELSFFNIGIFSDFTPNVSVQIPNNVKKLVIDGSTHSQVSLNAFNVDELTTNLPNSYVSLSGVKAKKMTLNSSDGIYLSADTSAKKATVETTDGDITLDSAYFDEIKNTTTSGDIRVQNARGNIQATTTDGDISVYDFKGEANFSSENGDFSLDMPAVPKKLTVALVHGDIYVNSGEILRNISIKGESKLGDVHLLNKERTSYKNGRADTEFNLSSEFGDITVDTPDDDNQ